MATIPVYTPAGEQAGELTLADEVFGLEPNAALLHQAVVVTLANNRQGTADTKTRGEVSGTTKKAWRQKGTGRARQGMRSAPHWKGGGVVFGPHPRDYQMAFPKKMRRKAILSALSARVGDGGFVVVEEFGIRQGKTKEAQALLTALGIVERKVLVVLEVPTEEVVRAFRNLPKVLLTTVDALGTYDVLDADRLLMTRDTALRLQELKQQPYGVQRWLAKQQQEGGAA